jgi:hypothetical protein
MRHSTSSGDRSNDLLLTGLILLALVGLICLVVGVLWPSAIGERLVTVGIAAVALGLIGHQLVMARQAADRGRADDSRRAQLPRER